MSSGFASNGLYWQTQAPLQKGNPTILFIHASWMSLTMWEETVQLLAPQLPNVNLLRIDLNGHGKTTAGRNEYTLWNQAEDVLALLKELELSKVVIAAISMGSMIALRLALLDQARFSGLVLLASNASAVTDAQRSAFYQLSDIWVATPAPSEQIMNAAILSWGGSPDLDGPRAKQIKQDWVQRHSGAENVLPTLNSMMERDSLLDRLGEIRGPVLLIQGEDDTTYPLQDAVEIKERLVNAEVRLEVIKGEGHLLIHLREAKDVAEWIQAFAQRVLG
ncbi:putative esterase YtxM [Aspergillus udagawae]|uniref:Putative esterase YtxM n=1 Tax=Aspergillus udagawae TaxID=91492 RepID=A0A8H3NDK3_9EURO|nr:putative esterase YtxM [Aspergillus udagawae]